MPGRCTLLDAARIDALRKYIAARGSVYLDARTYAVLRDNGLSRHDVNAAIGALLLAGEIIVEAKQGVVHVNIAPRPKAQEAGV
jgi:hypothetical protein